MSPSAKQRSAAQQVWRVFTFLIVAGLIWECLRSLRGDAAQLSALSLQHSWGLLVGATALSLGNYALRIVRWRYYLARLGHTLPIGFTALTYIAGFAFTVSPGKVGEMARARYYSRCGVPLSAVSGAFGTERLLDVLAMTVLAALMGAVAPRYRAAIWIAAGMVIVSLLLMMLQPWARGQSQLPRIAPAFVSRAWDMLVHSLTAARRLLQPKALLLGFVVGLFAWTLESLGLGLLAHMFSGPQVTTAVTSGIYAIGMLVGAISFLPGGLGSTEAVMSALLVSQGFPLGNALIITLACRLVTLWLAVGCGWLAVLALGETRQVAATTQ